MICTRCNIPMFKTTKGYQCPSCTFAIPNSWTRWHPFNPIKETREEIDRFYEEYESFIHYTDPNGKVGDIIEDQQRNLRIRINKYQCSGCGEKFENLDGIDKHLDLRKEIAKKHAVTNLETEMDELHKKAGMIELEEETFIPKAKVYYVLIRPEEILPIPRSAEVDLLKPVSKETKPPTISEREAHDKAMKNWRDQMAQTKGTRPLSIQLLPNGDISEKGASGRWWYHCPQKWIKVGGWVPLSTRALLPDRLVGKKIRVLHLLAIIPEEE